MKNIGFTLFLWSVLFALAEGALRVWEAVRPRGVEWTDGKLFMCEPDPARMWRYKARHQQAFRTPEFSTGIRTNSWRLRGPEVDASSVTDPSRLRVLAAGDSFFFGWGVEERDRFTERLEAGLRARGVPAAFLNAGHWSYALDQELLLLKEYVPRYRPRLVLLGFYPPGLVALLSHRWERDAHGRLVACHNDGIRVAPDGSLRFTNDYLERPPFSSRLASAVFRIWFNWRLSREAMTGDMALLDPQVSRFSHAWTMAEEVLAETGRYLSSEGVEWIAVGVPRDLQVSPDEWNDTYRRAAAGRHLDPDLPMKRFGPLVERAGGRWADLLPAFRSSYAPDLYFPLDPHWTAKGHGVAAAGLMDVVAAALAATKPAAAGAGPALARPAAGRGGGPC